MNWAWQQAGHLTSSELLVLLAYADYASDDGTAWPKNATVGAKVNMDARSIRRHVSSLEAKGLLRRSINGFEGVKYPIPPDQRPNLVVLNTGGQDCPPVTESTRREDESVPPGEDKAVRPREDKAVHQNHHYEPPLEPSTTTTDSNSNSSSETAGGGGPGTPTAIHYEALTALGYRSRPEPEPGELRTIELALKRGHDPDALIALAWRPTIQQATTPRRALVGAWGNLAARQPEQPARQPIDHAAIEAKLGLT